MKKILTSSITDSAQLPLLKRTIDHLQEQELENIKSCVYASLGSSNDSVPIVLWGCVGTLSTVDVSNDTLTVTAGAFIYLGEIYQISAQSITKTGANVFTLSLDTTTFQAGEPTIYSDGVTSVNTNQDLKIKLSQGLTGTGICDWDNRYFSSSVTTQSALNGNIANITLDNGTLFNCELKAFKKGNQTTLQGFINVTRTGSSTGLTLDLTPKFYVKDGATKLLLVPVNVRTAISNCDGTNNNLNTQIEFRLTPPISSGTYIIYTFNFTYENPNLL